LAADFAKKSKEAFKWVVAAETIENFLRYASSIILARLLFPEDYGLMGLASIAIQFSRRLTQFGLTSVLVQLKEIKNEHYDTVYWFNLSTMGFVAALVFFGAPYYAAYFGKPILVYILWLISIDFLFQAFSAVPTAILRRELRFKELAFAQTYSRLGTIVTAILLAFLGYGVWALVWGEVVGSVINRFSAIHFARKLSEWRPRFRITKWAFKDTFSFGLWMYVNAYITYGINNVDYFFIGKFLSTEQLGYYERAFNLMSMPRKRMVRKMNTVAFSTYSRLQDDKERLVRGLLQVTRYLSLASYPLMIWLYFAAPSLIVTLWGEKWESTVLPLQIMCLSGLIDSFTLIFQPLLKATGFIGNNTRRDLLYLIILTLGVLWGVFYVGAIAGVAMGVVFASITRFILTLNLTTRKLPLTARQFFRAHRSAIVYGSVQALLIFLMQYFLIPYVGSKSPLMLALTSVVAILGFYGPHAIFRFQDIDELIKDLGKDLQKTFRKIPVIKNLPFIKKKPVTRANASNGTPPVTSATVAKTTESGVEGADEID
jgi:PST family polysaccharide transporter